MDKSVKELRWVLIDGSKDNDEELVAGLDCNGDPCKLQILIGEDWADVLLSKNLEVDKPPEGG